MEKAVQEQIENTDLVLGIPIKFGLGFGLSDMLVQMPEDGFWWGGYGGSMCLMNLKHGYCLTYAMNRQIMSLVGDERFQRLAAAAHECLTEITPGFK